MKYIKHLCKDCGKERLISLSNYKGKHVERCKSCAAKKRVGSNHGCWKGGRTQNRGYNIVRIYQDNPYYCMATKNGSVRESRLIMAQYLGRPLELNEMVHHKNGDISDNRIDNLELISNISQHISLHHKGKVISESTRKKLSEAIKNSPLSKIARLKVAEYMKGRHLSEEHRKKISESMKKYPGHSVSVETRMKISETLKKWHKENAIQSM